MENKRTETNKTVQKRLEPELKLINMDTVEVEQIEWLLYPFIPYGKVTIIQGDPGEGKTTMVLQIIAKLTRGETILPAYPPLLQGSPESGQAQPFWLLSAQLLLPTGHLPSSAVAHCHR